MSIIAELKRRNVFRAAAFYAASAWLLVQVATQVFPFFHIAEWVVRWIVIAAIIGFPFGMLFSWFYEWTPQGIQRESEIEQDTSITRETGKTMDRWIIAVLSLAVVLLLANTFVMHKDETAAQAPGKSIAVLPFDNRSGDRSQDYFADGLTDELTTTLARISALKVIARASAARYKGTNKSASLIGRELGVATLVTGSVLRAGGRVRYTAELVSTSTETTLWADSYERDERDILALQADVASAIAKAIAVRLSPDEATRLASSKPVDPKAFDEYLRGRSLWNQRSEPAVREALIHFQNATRVAPDFALGYAGLADSYIILGVYGYDPPRDAFPAAKAAAKHAIELDPTAGEPHASLGDIHFHFDWDWAESEREHERAITLAPGFATAYHWGSEALLLTGDLRGALARARRARLLDPLSMTIRAALAQTLVINGRRDEALAELHEALALDPDFPRTRLELARELLALGRRDEALVEARRMVATNPDYLPGLATLGLCLGATGHSGEARALLARLESARHGHFVSSLELARITAGLGDRDATLRYLQQAVVAREGFLPFLVEYEEFDFLHDDPRFGAIVREIGIPPARFAAPRTVPTTHP